MGVKEVVSECALFTIVNLWFQKKKWDQKFQLPL